MGLVCEINVKWPCVCFCTQSRVIAMKLDSAEVCRSLQKVMGGLKLRGLLPRDYGIWHWLCSCLWLCFCKPTPDFRFSSSLFSKGVCICIVGKEWRRRGFARLFQLNPQINTGNSACIWAAHTCCLLHASDGQLPWQPGAMWQCCRSDLHRCACCSHTDSAFGIQNAYWRRINVLIRQILMRRVCFNRCVSKDGCLLLCWDNKQL